MILIDGTWESIDTIEDIIRVVGDHYNPELAEALRYVSIPSEEMGQELSSLYEEIDNLESDNENLEDNAYDLDREIDDLKAKIEELTQENEKLCNEIDALVEERRDL